MIGDPVASGHRVRSPAEHEPRGRKPSIDAGEVLRLRRDEKLGPAAIARRLGIGRASVYRLLGKQTSTGTNRGADADQAIARSESPLKPPTLMG
jgi:hypothetical protein